MVTPMLNRLVPCLYFCAVMLASFMSAPSANATMSDVHCSIQWENIKTTRDKAVLNSHLKNCGASKSGREARARLAILSKPDVPPPPPPPPPPSRCDRLSQAAKSGREGDLQTFVSSCPEHLQFGDAQRRLHNLRGLKARQKLDLDLARWGLNFTDLCGLERGDLYKKANAELRLPEIRNSAAKSDSVASLLLGYSQQYDFYKTGESQGAAAQNFLNSANLNNPRGMAEYALFYLTQFTPNVEVADYWIEKSAKLGCGTGLYLKARRSNNGNYSDSKRPAWAPVPSVELTSDFYRSAIAVQHGGSACALAYLLYPNNPEKRVSLLEQATKLGNRCGEMYQFFAAWWGVGQFATDKPGAFRAIKALADAGFEDAHWLTHVLMTYPVYGGSADNLNSVPYLKRAAEIGDPDAMAELGRAFAKGDKSVTVNRQTAVDWCYRADKLGNPNGSVCVGMITRDYKSWIDRAFKKDACAPYNGSVHFLPNFLHNLSREALTNKVSNLKITELLSIKFFLKDVTYAMSLSAGSNSGCSKDAKIWSDIIETLIEPVIDPGAAAARKQGK
jgi:TPR repeat protein